MKKIILQRLNSLVKETIYAKTRGFNLQLRNNVALTELGTKFIKNLTMIHVLNLIFQSTRQREGRHLQEETKGLYSRQVSNYFRIQCSLGHSLSSKEIGSYSILSTTSYQLLQKSQPTPRLPKIVYESQNASKCQNKLFQFLSKISTFPSKTSDFSYYNYRILTGIVIGLLLLQLWDFYYYGYWTSTTIVTGLLPLQL